jgi:hypothetical protein
VGLSVIAVTLPLTRPRVFLAPIPFFNSSSTNFSMAAYLHNIPSVHILHPDVPAVLGELDLNQGIVAGQPLARQHLTHARVVSKTLSAINGIWSYSANVLICIVVFRVQS